ncbi:MAG: hypothetical protein IJP54_00940 [Synergistaceae bacterium]|nr:hypothetical protein [Synergistaceae bacterium]MBR0034217.1 hypothetical protein [Synergistaceae bacterium]
MKRIILLIMSGMFMLTPAFGADDDSTPYMPYPETPPQTQPAKAPTKKPAPKKKAAPKKKPAPKKKTPKKAAKPKAPASPSSLQQGIALLEQDRYEQAKRYLLKAIQEDRNNPNVWYWYGVYHEKTGGFHQAQYFYSKAITIDPAFEPLSRVVYYPEDPEKTPLWDPKRPARVYPVQTQSTGGLSTVPAGLPGRSSFPEAPDDPELPHVPVYTPPEPGAAPFDGDAWSPAVYVPPSPEEVQTEGEMSPQYLPPEPQSIIAQESPTGRQVLEIPVRYPEGYEQPEPAQRDTIIRADKPLYTPPNPGEKPPVVPKQTQAVKKQNTAPAKNADAKIQETSGKRRASVPDSRIVRQSQRPKKSAPRVQRQTTRRPGTTASRDVRPQTPARPPQPQRQTPPPQQTQPAPEPVTPARRPAPVRQENTQNQEYMPPAGQYAPDPGTIPENPLPPVGQGSQN